MNIEYIYLIREREFSYLNKPIYKLGRTNNIKNRMNSYPKDSDVYLVEPVSDSVSIEKALIEIFEERYQRATTEDGVTTIGNEYFVGNLDEMIYIIRTYIRYHYPSHFV